MNYLKSVSKLGNTNQRSNQLANKLILILFLLITSCKSLEGNSVSCKENIKFKETFFDHIEYVERNISQVQNTKFRESVIFISNYAPVSVDYIMNYARSYPIGIFQEDRGKWTDWYEENKCTNIQFKETYIIPEAYQFEDGLD